MQSNSSSQNRLSATGIGMLFSAGTFLYVATVHVLPEINSRGQQRSTHLHHHTGTRSYQQQDGLGITESLTLILGAGLPVLLALGLPDDWSVETIQQPNMTCDTSNDSFLNVYIFIQIWELLNWTFRQFQLLICFLCRETKYKPVVCLCAVKVRYQIKDKKDVYLCSYILKQFLFCLGD